VELFEAIRRDHRRDELSIRQLADRHGVHRRTVRQALASAVPPPRKGRVFAAPRLDPVKPLIDAMLREDLDAPRKQRHTARRVLARLVDEHQVVEISYSTVSAYVARRRPEIAAEAGRPLEVGCVPQTHEPAAEAEVDFHDLWVVLRGVKTKTALFTMRLSFSGRAVHRASLSQGQEAFLEGHVYAFDRLAGVPIDKIRYDNLKPAVSRVMFGRTRQETQRWVAFRSTYGFDAFYCQPGHEGSHEKGGVEGEGGRFRRNHCVPLPRVDSIAELNALLESWDEGDDARRVGNRAASVGQDWALERPLLRPLPAEPFDTALILTPRVDRYAQVMVRCCQYSVPARFIGHRVRVRLSSSMVSVFDRATLVASHERSAGKGVAVLVLDHYLEILMRKPGALPGATALAQARAAGVFTVVHEAFWAAARKAHGDSAGTRALIEVLLLHRHLDRADVLAGITAALSVGSTSADVVAVQARKAAQRGAGEGPESSARGERVVSLTERRLATLPGEDRPLPSMQPYDQLLARGSS
jgi:transposase